MSPKIITVFGATGNQGGAVVRSLLQNKSGAFKVRGITRNPDSDAAKQLASSGVEVVKADGFNKSELLGAFTGSYGVFVNTNSDDPSFDDPKNPTELQLGKGIVDAASEAGVKHFIYSGSTSPAKLTNGEINSLHFESKYSIAQYAQEVGRFDHVSIISPGWYLENFLVPELAPVFGGFPSVPDEEGYLTLACPKWGGKEDVPFVSISEDYGDFVHAMFLDPKTWNGKTVGAVSHAASFDQAVANFTKVTGAKSRWTPLASWKDLETYGMASLVTVRDMFGFCQLTGGLYFGTPTETETTAALKKAAAEAKGLTGPDAELMTLERFYKTYFVK